MIITSSTALRQIFLEFFQSKGHTLVSSSSLIPANDPSLMFVNAGMVPFKDTFLGRETRDYVRATSSQRCVRAGGKHNDLENVGYTARHHTFFEMLGNFSFGDYFKREAIEYAWEFLTQTLQIPVSRLWVTVFEEDQEAADLWLQHIGVDPQRFSRIGAADNFWSMGDTGPCGPCTEIFYDHGPTVAGGPPGSAEADGDRFVEIWNLVFMQYDRAADGRLTPLPKPSVDTGMGLERLAAVMQGVTSNYEIDLFRHLIQSAAQLAGINTLDHASLRVIADHIRSCAFLIADGVTPSNEGRDYVLRRIIRRAVLHGHKLGLTAPFFHRLVAPLVAEMGEAYPELMRHQAKIEQILHLEETRFFETLEHGLKILQRDIAELTTPIIPGATLFKLYSTCGFPPDLSRDIALEQGLSLDMEGFAAAMAQEQERSRISGKFSDFTTTFIGEAGAGATVFTGYEQMQTASRVVALYREDQAVSTLMAGEQGQVVLASTPFYAESGGQAGDQGQLCQAQGHFEVTDTQKQNKMILHCGRVTQGNLTVGMDITAAIDPTRRQAIRCNHSATHLLHAALRQILGTHVTQKGSAVDAARLRFDFSHFEPVSYQQLTAIEQCVNQQIRYNHAVTTQLMEMQAAIASGAMALFDEKYEAKVRVLAMGDFSLELCGGTHVAQTGDIGLFKITMESGVASGIRRIEAVTAQGAMDWLLKLDRSLLTIAELVKGSRDTAVEKVQQLTANCRQLEKNLEQLKTQQAQQAGGDLAAQAVEMEGGLKVLAQRLDGVDAKSLRGVLDQLKDKLKSAVIVLSVVEGNKIQLLAGVTKDYSTRLDAVELVKNIAQQVGGKGGGGRAEMAQAGGTDINALASALASVQPWVRSKLAH